MKKVIRLTESDLMRIVKRVLNEQEGGQDPESTEKLVVDRDWWTLDLKPKLKAAGFVEKVDPPQHNKPCLYKCCNYMYKGNHNTGTNVMLDCYNKTMGNWMIVVYNKGNQNQREFSLDNNGISQAIKYAINLK